MFFRTSRSKLDRKCCFWVQKFLPISALLGACLQISLSRIKHLAALRIILFWNCVIAVKDECSLGIFRDSKKESSWRNLFHPLTCRRCSLKMLSKLLCSSSAAMEALFVLPSPIQNLFNSERFCARLIPQLRGSKQIQISGFLDCEETPAECTNCLMLLRICSLLFPHPAPGCGSPALFVFAASATLAEALKSNTCFCFLLSLGPGCGSFFYLFFIIYIFDISSL